MNEDIKARIEEYLVSSTHLSKRHVHPRLLKLLELGGISTAFVRAEGNKLYDKDGTEYLDFLAGGGVYFMGRNHPRVREYLETVLALDLPNMCVVNASVFGGQLAEELLGLAGPSFSKVIYCNSGAECTEVMVRFARYVTKRRRFLHLEGSFHGRTYAAISLCGFQEMKERMDPQFPTVTPIKANDLAQLRRELKMGDVAGLIMEPVLGMTETVVDPGYMREAELLCQKYGTLLLVDEVQTGLGRTGHWFASVGQGVRPSMMSISKTLSGGHVPIGAVLLSEEVYDTVYNKIASGPIYFSTFAENNLAMVAGLATLEVLKELDAPAQAEWKGQYLRDGLESLAMEYDVIDRIAGKGLMCLIYFKDSAQPRLLAQQKLMEIPDKSAFAAAINVDMYTRQHVIVQIPGPGLNGIKILPPVTSTQEDIDLFLHAFSDSLAACYEARSGPLLTISRGIAEKARKTVTDALPDRFVPPFLKGEAKDETPALEEKKNP